MRWNCPHCGIALSVADEQLGPGWCFSKCYQCSGFSLVRASEQGAVRLDGRPPASPPPLPQFKPSQRVIDATRRVAPPVEAPIPARAAAPKPAKSGIFGRVASAAALTVLAYALYSWVTTPIPLAKAPVLAQPVVVAAQAPAAASAKSVVTDSIAREAMAPERAPVEAPVPPARPVGGLEVESLSPRVQLRSGPGIQYPVVATVDPRQAYPVIDWSERWFRVALELNADGSGRKFAWVRNDLVKLVRKGR